MYGELEIGDKMFMFMFMFIYFNTKTLSEFTKNCYHFYLCPGLPAAFVQRLMAGKLKEVLVEVDRPQKILTK